MKLKAGYKYSLSLVIALTAVMLCILPFLAVKKDTLYVYTEQPNLSVEEQGFIRELRRLGLSVIVNKQFKADKEVYALWFKNPNYAAKISDSSTIKNFLYTEAYYPFDWKSVKNPPIILTPYREIYEHYMRYNVKSAIMMLGTDTSVFYQRNAKKRYALVYSGDNNKNAPITEYLKNHTTALFLGTFWPKDYPNLSLKASLPKGRAKVLSETQKVVVYNEKDAPESKRVPKEIMEATVCGALVFTTYNKAVEDMYQDNIIFYTNEEDLKEKLAMPFNAVLQDKVLKAQKITTEKLSSAAAAKRFKELLDWVKNNQNSMPND